MKTDLTTEVEEEQISSTEVMILDEIHQISSEEDFLNLMELMKSNGLFGDPISCPFCGKNHTISKNDSDKFQFDCDEKCLLLKCKFDSKLDAIKTMKELSTFITSIKQPPVIPYVRKHIPKINEKPKSFDHKTHKRPEIPFSQQGIAGQFKKEPFNPPALTSVEKPEIKPKNRKKVIIINHIKELQGKKYKHKEIATELNKRGIKTVSGAEWSKSNVASFIANHINQRKINIVEPPKITMPKDGPSKEFLIDTIKEYRDKNHTQSEIADLLNKNGITTISGLQWSKGNIAFFISTEITNPKQKPVKEFEPKTILKKSEPNTDIIQQTLTDAQKEEIAALKQITN